MSLNTKNSRKTSVQHTPLEAVKFIDVAPEQINLITSTNICQRIISSLPT